MWLAEKKYPIYPYYSWPACSRNETCDQPATVKVTAVNNAEQKLKIMLQVLFWFGLAGIAVHGTGRQTEAEPNPEEQFTQLIQPVGGPDLFRAYCAPCHGLDAKGAGPAAAALKARVPDLTLLASRNQGQFPAPYVRKMILGDQEVPAHGSREMPIWGPIFHQVERDMDWGNVRVTNLVAYVRSIQSPAASGVPTGAELYQQHCAVCHGTDLKGTGPAPYPFRAPPDLTTLAKRHGGVFPENYVTDVLRNGVVMPAHGPAEMPIWGADFASDQSAQPQIALRIKSLTNYIKSLQEN
jgi:mono/diheme cytochrome c family protein